jgi:hypothetical protein
MLIALMLQQKIQATAAAQTTAAFHKQLKLSFLATCVHLVLTLALILTRTRQPLPAEQLSLQDSAMVPGYCDMIKPRTDSFISVHVHISTHCTGSCYSLDLWCAFVLA